MSHSSQIMMRPDDSPIPSAELFGRMADVLSEAPELSTAEIARRSGVSRATLYRYFAGKAELLEALALHCIESIDAACAGVGEGAASYQEVFRELFAAIVPVSSRFLFLARLPEAFESRAVRASLARQDDEMIQLVRSATIAGEIDPALSARWVVQYFNAMVWLAWTEVAAGYLAPRSAPGLAFETFWRAARTPER